ncbi:MAG: TRAP transporter substrate-binding protein, partial [Synergistaceae bacterium]|nr:TRAP transporter substrate-binding protein [Synergistaceae bacterium]
VRADMDEELAYNLLKTFIEKRDEFMDVTPQAANFIPDLASKGIIPFHPGAIKYFKEKGIDM